LLSVASASYAGSYDNYLNYDSATDSLTLSGYGGAIESTEEAGYLYFDSEVTSPIRDYEDACEKVTSGDHYGDFRCRIASNLIIETEGRLNADIDVDSASSITVTTDTESNDDDIVDAAQSSSPLTVSTGDGNDEINGGSGNDMIKAGYDDDNITGGGGNDTVSYNDSNDVYVTNSDSYSTGECDSGRRAIYEIDCIASDIESAQTGSGDDIVKLTANSGSYSVDTGSGNDDITLTAGSTSPEYSVVCGDGTDELDVSGQVNVVTTNGCDNEPWASIETALSSGGTTTETATAPATITVTPVTIAWAQKLRKIKLLKSGKSKSFARPTVKLEAAGISGSDTVKTDVKFVLRIGKGSTLKKYTIDTESTEISSDEIEKVKLEWPKGKEGKKIRKAALKALRQNKPCRIAVYATGTRSSDSATATSSSDSAQTTIQQLIAVR